MAESMVVTVFGSLTSFLLGILVVIGRNLTNELKEMRKTVTDHGLELSKIGATLKHLDRRADSLENHTSRVAT